MTSNSFACEVPLDVFNPECVSRRAISRVSDRWTVLVLLALKDGTRRFNEIRRALRDVSQKMLTQTLRKLEADGVIDREVIATVPTTVNYTLTPTGRSLLTIVEDLERWAYEHAMEMYLSAQKAEAGATGQSA